jgi:hypothetical protein
MGTENIWLIALGGFGAYLGNVCYMAGGTSGFGLWWRRFLGSFILASSANIVAIILHAWVWQYLLFWPILIAGMSLGYGSSQFWIKVLKRTIFALGVVMTCVIGAWIAHWSSSALLVLGLSIATGLTSVLLGVFNPFKNAPLEQFIICQVLTLYVPWWSFVS